MRKKILSSVVIAFFLAMPLSFATLPITLAQGPEELEGHYIFSLTPSTFTLNSGESITLIAKLEFFTGVWTGTEWEVIPVEGEEIEFVFYIDPLPDDYIDYWGSPWGDTWFTIRETTDSNGEASLIYTAPIVSSPHLQEMFEFGGYQVPQTLNVGVLATRHIGEGEDLFSRGTIVPTPENIPFGDMGIGRDAGDSFEEASLISVGSGTGKLDNFDRTDYYKISVSSGQMVSAGMTPPSGANFDLDVYDPHTGSANSSHNLGDETDAVAYTATASGYLYIQVGWKSGAGTYSMTVTSDHQDDMGTGGDAGYDFDTAALISSSITDTGYIDESDPADLYKIYVGSGQATSVFMTPPSGADFDLWIWGSGYPMAQASLDLYSDASLFRIPGAWESVATTATIPGYCYILVMRHNGSGTYSMEVLTSGVVDPTLPYITEPVKETSPVIPSIEPGEPESIEFENVDITIIKVRVENQVYNVEVEVEVLAEKPSGLLKAPGWVYEYIEVLAENLEERNIENVEIEFKIEKSWAARANIDEENIALCRYDNSRNEWIPLPTTKIGEDADYLYFSAVSPSLSLFAITAGVRAVEPSSPSQPGLELVAIAVIVLIGVVVALCTFRIRSRRRGGYEII